MLNPLQYSSKTVNNLSLDALVDIVNAVPPSLLHFWSGLNQLVLGGLVRPKYLLCIRKLYGGGLASPS